MSVCAFRDFDILRNASLSSTFFCDRGNDLFVKTNIDLVRAAVVKPFVWILPDLFFTKTSWNWIVLRRSCHIQFSLISFEATLMDVIGMHWETFGSNGSIKWHNFLITFYQIVINNSAGVDVKCNCMTIWWSVCLVTAIPLLLHRSLTTFYYGTDRDTMILWLAPRFYTIDHLCCHGSLSQGPCLTGMMKSML